MEEKCKSIANLLCENKALRRQLYTLMDSPDEEEKKKFMAGIGFPDVDLKDFLQYLSLQ